MQLPLSTERNVCYLIHTHTNIYICVCVCVCIKSEISNLLMFIA